MHKILTLNNISVAGLERLPRDRYEIASEIQHPDAVLLRSFNMHGMDVPPSLKAVGRAGAGVNNIPVEKLSGMGIPVFNAPGANANAVKELVVAGMLLGCRNICQAWDYARRLEGDDDEIHRQTEAGKKKFVGFELPGRTLGVVGLGAVGVQVANAALALGMKVIGYDPDITVQRAWQMSSDVQPAHSIDDLLSQVDFITFHVPLIDATAHTINAERLKHMKEGVVILNFARQGIVDDKAMVEALDSGKAYGYVCDFPGNLLKDHPRVVTLPHIGASTKEAEDNCAAMVAEQVREYLENGNVRNSVNFPEVLLPRNGGFRLTVVNDNVPNMLGQISTDLANAGLNIIDMLNKSNGNLAYTVVDVESEIPDRVVEEIAAIKGVLAVRTLDQQTG
ncbi:MAG: phosphoglycerate dehydrogenase [Gammaproteobacteria bacterium]|nr:phosphoglycerate dehydrogenase [Gammaproteobacteria bacterium]NIR96561.1 phosphoglycerate dehydrogenase [Gammaproteobacteria bacterium]NIT62299.1 phosphoglycerate dehydrogenase [Gammaproteobacteria bacterium]NIV19203.1 3-phosphoglycerate dehydrogenase [Gammaproteobacteria bacterium]NIX10071.1 3-phosphoglycerate dehydrogenase [Gammaproteobacteria bacterium]